MPTPQYVSSLKEQILRIKRKKDRERGVASTLDEADSGKTAKSGGEEPAKLSESEDDPWQRALAHRDFFEKMQQRRRVVIPFQPSPTQLRHMWYPPDVYVQYTFVLTPSKDADDEAIPALRYRIASKRTRREVPATVPGYVVGAKRRKTQSEAEREKILPADTRKRVGHGGGEEA